MTGSNGDNQLGPGDSSSSNYVIGSPFTAKEAAGNLLWRYAKDIPSELWNLVKAPGQVYSGELQPSMTPGPNQLSVPEYALGLAGTGLGIGGGAALAGAELAPEGAITHFPAFHGTGVGTPFQQFENKFIDTGEGAQIYGWGHYVAQSPETAMQYRRSVGGTEPVPLDDKGYPLSAEDTFNKYYEPGSILKLDPQDAFSKFAKVDRIGTDDYGNKAAFLQEVEPNWDKIQSGMQMKDIIDKPEYWNEMDPNLANPIVRNGPPSSLALQHAGEERGWKMGDPGAFLHVNVVPEEHEMLPWDAHYSEMPPEMQSNLKNAGFRKGSAEDPTGEDIYRRMSDQFYYDAEQSGGNPDMMVSQHLDTHGIPGIKYYDAGSRYMGATIDHMNGFAGAPDANLASSFTGGRPFHTTNLDTAMNDMYGDVRRKIGYLQDDLDMPGATGSELIRTQNAINNHQATLNWMQKEHAAGNFRLNDPRTSNYVVFDPRNIEIKTWNDQPLTPVDHDPFPGGWPGEVPNY